MIRFLALAFFAACLSHADTVILNDGTKIDGTIVEESNDSITLKVKFGTVPYKKSEIKEIQRSGSSTAAPAAADLRDVLVLKNGEEHRGFLVSENNNEIVFDLIMSGKSVSKTMLSRTTFKTSEVSDVKKLSDAQRAAARTQLESAAAQARQDVASEQNMIIDTATWHLKKDNQPISVKRVELENFTVETDVTDDEFIKKATYRLGRVFNAYKQHFGVDRNQTRKVTINIFNSMEEYYVSIGGGMKNPAFYAPQLKLICAGCDVAKYEAQIAQIRQYHNDLDRQIEDWKFKISQAREQVRIQASRAYSAVNAGGKGATPQGQAALEAFKSQQIQWQVEIAQMEKTLVGFQDKIAECNKHNDTFFNEYTREMMATLYHEGFHAFLDNFLFPQTEHETIPRWLNEGLAQYFEASRLEGSRFVLGQDDRVKLIFLRKYRKDGTLLSLEKLVNGGASDYLVHDITNLENSTRNYLQAWMLVQVVGEKNRLNRENLEAYVKLLIAKKPPLDALPTLSGMSNAELEKAMEEKLKYGFENQLPGKK